MCAIIVCIKAVVFLVVDLLLCIRLLSQEFIAGLEFIVGGISIVVSFNACAFCI